MLISSTVAARSSWKVAAQVRPRQQAEHEQCVALGCQLTRIARSPSRTSTNVAPDDGNAVMVVIPHGHPAGAVSRPAQGKLFAFDPSLGEHRVPYGTIGGVPSTEQPPTATPRVVAWSPEQFTRRVGEAMNIYVRAMNYPPHAGSERAVTARRHAAHHGFACRAALLDDDTLVGFGYGYTTVRGQWWHDLVRKALESSQAALWLNNAFELSELHVLPEYQGTGTGRRLLTELAGVTEAQDDAAVDAGHRHPRLPAVPAPRVRRSAPPLSLPG